MFRSHAASLIAAPLLAAILVAACQKQPARSVADLTPPDPAPEEAASAPISTDLTPPHFAGRWFVSAVYPKGGGPANPGDPHLGASIVIDTAETSDVNGQLCVGPYLAADRTEEEMRLGDVLLRGLERLSVTCQGRDFATYFLLPGKHLDAGRQGDAAGGEAPFMLIAERPEAHYLLERAEQVLFRQASVPAALPGEGGSLPVSTASTAKAAAPAPAPAPVELAPAAAQPVDPTLQAPLILAPAMPEPVPEPAPAAATPAPAKPAAAPVEAVAGASLPTAGTAIHLASYSGISAAKRGWKTLLGEFDALDPLSPLYVEIDVPEKGRMIRLYATGADAAGLNAACSALAAKGAYCQMAR